METPDDCLQQLNAQYPNIPFLALGQTVFWDEPTKATLFLHRVKSATKRPFVAGIHDTDYFAKLPGHPSASKETPFALVPHDDVTTRGLWSAAGEMSRLFGSEDVPTRGKLVKEAGVQLSRLTQEEQATHTTAWGWTGLIETGWKKSIVAEIPLGDIKSVLLEQIEWATENSETGQALSQCVRQYAETNPHATLPDLYEALLPGFWEMLLGATPSEFSTTRTTQLLKFNTQTASLPRFAFVELFLAPKTRGVAKDAYNLAVQGSDIYPLTHFGEDALPFDLFIPTKGRGTLYLTPGGTLTIDAGENGASITLKGTPITNLGQLAARVETAFGTECVLLGKAVTLIPMLAAEFIFTMHEGASAYTERTHTMLEILRKKSVALPVLHPILRLKYDTWSALSALPNAASTYLNLPPFLEQATGRTKIAADDFAACWKERLQDEKQLLRELSSAQKPRDLMAFLRDTNAQTQYENTTQTLLKIRQKGITLYEKRHALYADIRTLRSRYNALQNQQGADTRAHTPPFTSEHLARRQKQFAEPMQALREQIQIKELEARRNKNTQDALEDSLEVTEARETLRNIEVELEKKRIVLAQNALQTVYGLPHTSYRPSFWWFLQVDPSENWFRKTAETAKLYLEVL